MEALFVHVMIWGKSEGYHWFSLGMAPMSGFEQSPVAPLWTKAGIFLYEHGESDLQLPGIEGIQGKIQAGMAASISGVPRRIETASHSCRHRRARRRRLPQDFQPERLIDVHSPRASSSQMSKNDKLTIMEKPQEPVKPPASPSPISQKAGGSEPLQPAEALSSLGRRHGGADDSRQQPEPDRAENHGAHHRHATTSRDLISRALFFEFFVDLHRHLRAVVFSEYRSDVRRRTHRQGSAHPAGGKDFRPGSCLYPAGHSGETADEPDVGRRRHQDVRVAGHCFDHLFPVPDHWRRRFCCC